MTNAEAPTTQARGNLFETTLLWVVAAVGVVGIVVLLIIPHFILPGEDAVILFQFSRNLAHTGAISYIANGPHAEGATDFAWMVLLAAGMKLHLNPFWMATTLSALCLAALPFLLARIAGRRLEILPAFFIIGAFALMPQLNAAASGFSVLPFALLLVAMVLAFLRNNDPALALLALLTCLFRPDGVVFALPLMAAALYLYPNRSRRCVAFASLFVIPGIAYFLWRWHYFGQLLPLPFLVKSNVDRMAHFLVVASLEKGLLLAIFGLAIAWLVLRGQEDVKRSTLAVLLCILVLPNFFYFAMRLDQNIGHRFFVYMPVGAALMLAMEWETVSRRRGYFLAVGFLLWVVLISRITWNEWSYLPGRQHANRKAIADELAQLPQGTLIVTEAGLLPYYSNWSTYDAWGLNTTQFASHLFQPTDVEKIRPDLIMVFFGSFDLNGECTMSAAWHTPYDTRSWQHLTRNIIAGAQPPRYDLWYTPYDTSLLKTHPGTRPWQVYQECWLVRHDSALRPGMESILQSHYGLPVDVYLEKLASDKSAAPSPTPARSNAGKRSFVRAVAHRGYSLWLLLSS